MNDSTQHTQILQNRNIDFNIETSSHGNNTDNMNQNNTVNDIIQESFNATEAIGEFVEDTDGSNSVLIEDTENGAKTLMVSIKQEQVSEASTTEVQAASAGHLEGPGKLDVDGNWEVVPGPSGLGISGNCK